MNHDSGTLTLEMPTREALGKLEENVQNLLNGRVRDFHLSMHERGLVLRGYTHTYYAKQLAQHAVMEAVELPICANDIEVF